MKFRLQIVKALQQTQIKKIPKRHREEHATNKIIDKRDTRLSHVVID
jgi:hypothetical protein